MVGLGIDSRGRTDSQGLEVIEKQRYIVLPFSLQTARLHRNDYSVSRVSKGHNNSLVNYSGTKFSV